MAELREPQGPSLILKPRREALSAHADADPVRDCHRPHRCRARVDHEPVSPGRTLAIGLLGAWAGFVLGALAGLLIDVLTDDGVYLAIFGYVAAVAGGFLVARRSGRNDAASHTTSRTEA